MTAGENDFAWGAVTDEPPPKNGATPVPETSRDVSDPMAEADAVRRANAKALSQLVWKFPDGRRVHLRLTSSRWALYEALQPSLKGPRPDYTGKTQDEIFRLELAATRSERYLTSCVLLWLCCHESSAWESPRPRDVPLINDWPALLAEVRRWADEQIPPHELDEVVDMAEDLAQFTFSALAVPRPNDDPDTEEVPQKKTPAPTGRQDTSPSSAAPFT